MSVDILSNILATIQLSIVCVNQDILRQHQPAIIDRPECIWYLVTHLFPFGNLNP